MVDITFDDLIPKAEEPVKPAVSDISFDDLIPAKPAASTTVPRRTASPDLVTDGPGPTGTISRDLYDMGAIARRPVGLEVGMPQEKRRQGDRPSTYAPEYDPFRNESMLDTAKRTGQQIARGVTSAVAGVPAATGLAAAGADRRVQEWIDANPGKAGEEAAERQSQVMELTNRLADPALSEKERIFIQQRRDELQAGIDRLMGRGGPTPAPDTAGLRGSQTIKDASTEIFGTPDPRDTSLRAKLAEGLGSVLGYAAPGVLLTKAMALATGITAGAGTNGEQVYKDAIANGADEATAQEAAEWAMAGGATEFLPIFRAVNVLPSPLRGNAAGRILNAMLEEGTQEGALQAYNNLIAAGYYDPERGWSEGVTESMVVGAILGGGLRGTTEILTPGGDDVAPIVGPKGPPDEPKVTTLDPASPIDPATAAALAPDTTQPPGDQPVPPQVDPDVAAALAPEAAAAPAAPKRTAAEIAVDTVTRGRAPPPAVPEPEASVAEAPVAEPTAPPVAEEPAPVGEVPSVPESKETIEAQRQALRDGAKPIVLYPFGTVPPPEMGAGFKRTYINNVGRFDYDPKVLTDREIRAIVKAGKLNELLEMGPYSKAAVAASTAAGSPPAGVVERTPAGTEVKAAAGTLATAPDQAAAMEATKASPENTIQVEDPRKVVADRVAAAETERATAEAERAARLAAVSQEEKDELARKYAPAAPVAPAAQPTDVAAAPAVQAAKMPSARTEAEKAPARPAKAEAAVAVSKAKEKGEVTQPGKLTEPEPEISERDKAILRAVQKADEKIAAERRRGSQTKEQAEQRAAKSEAKQEDIEKADRGEISDPAAEARIRRTEETKDAKREAAAVERAVKTAKLQEDTAPKVPENIKTKRDAALVYDRIRKTLAEAKKRGISAPARIQKQHTNAQVWLASLQTMARKLERLTGDVSPATSAQIMSDLAAFLGDETVYLFTGDATGLRASRLQAGEQVAGRSGALNEQTTAAEDPRADEEDDVGEAPDEAVDLGETASEGADDGDQSIPEMTREEVLSVAPLPEAELDPESVLAAKDLVGKFKVEVKKQRSLVGKPGARFIGGRANQGSADPFEQVPYDWAEQNTDFSSEFKDAVRAFLKQIGYDGGAVSARQLREILSSFGSSLWEEAGGFYDQNYPDDMRMFVGLLHDLGVDFGGNSAEFILAQRKSTVGTLLAVTKKQLSDLLDDTVSAPQFPALAEIIKQSNTLDAIVTHMRGLLTKLVGKTPVYYLEESDYRVLNGDRIEGYYQYNSHVESVVLQSTPDRDDLDQAHTAFHEALHAAMLHALKTDKVLRQRVDLLRAHVARKATETGYKGSMYFNTNADEFMSEALSNPEFIEFLATLPVPDHIKTYVTPKGILPARLKSVLDAVLAEVAAVLQLDKLREALGIGRYTTTAFDLTMALAGTALNVSPAARRSYFGRTAYDGFAFQRAEMRTPGRAKPSKVELKLRKLGLSPSRAAEVRAALADFDNLTDAELKAVVDAIAGELPEEVKRSKNKLTSAFDGTISGIRKQAEKAHSETMKQLKGDFMPGKQPRKPHLLWAATNYQLGEISDRFFGKANNPVRTIAAWVERRRITKANYMKEATPVIQAWADAEKKYTEKAYPGVWDNFTALAHEVTLANMHPDVPLDHERNKHLGKKALKGVWAKSLHAGLSARYQALPDDLKEAYAQGRDLYTETQNRMALAATRNELTRLGFMMDEEGQAMALRFHTGTAKEADYNRVGPTVSAHLEAIDFLRKIEGPYFNLVRRGEYVVKGRYKITPPPNAKVLAPHRFEFTDRKEAEAWVGTQELPTKLEKVWIDKDSGTRVGVDTDGKEVMASSKDGVEVYWATVQDEYLEFVDSQKEAVAIREELLAKGMEMDAVEAKKYEREAQNAEMLADQFLAMKGTLGKREKDTNLSPQQIAEMKSLLNEVSARFLGSSRIQTSRIHRRNVAGADRDMTRNMFDYVDSASGYLAKLDTAPMLENALVELERRVTAQGKESGFEVNHARLISNEIEKRVYARIPGEDDGTINNGINRILSVTFLANLASPSYSIVNSTQVALVTFPVLAGDFNPAGASIQLAKAYKDIGAFGIAAGGLADTARAAKGKMVTADRFVDDVKANLKPDEKRMIDELAEEGLIDADGGQEIARIVDRRKDTVWGKVDSGIYYLDNIARALPGAIEAINRSVTALAAYRMHFNKFKDHTQAVQYAKDVVNDTQMLMANSNAPPIMSHWLGRVSFQFKKFSQGMYYLLGKNFNRAFARNGQSLEERLRGAATLMYISGTTASMAGVVGLPGLELIRVLSMILYGIGADDDNWQDYEEKIAKYFEEMFGEDMGEMIAFGAPRGIPGGWAPDFSGRVGMQNLMVFGEPAGNNDEDVKAFMFDFFMGPFGRELDGLGALMASIAGGSAFATPTDAAKTVEGLIPVKLLSDTAKAMRGLARGSMDVQDAVLRIAGFTSGDQANLSRDIGASISETSKKSNERKRVEGKYLDARTQAEIAKAKSAVRDFIAAQPKGTRVTSLATLEKWRQERVDQEQKYRN